MFHFSARCAWPMRALLLASSCLLFQAQSASAESEGSVCDASGAECVAEVSSLAQLRALPRANSKSLGLSAGPGRMGPTEDHGGSEACVVTVAVGTEFIKTAKKTGVSKQGYANKWNYTYLPYFWDTPDEFLSWAYSTELGSRFARGDLWMTTSSIKYFAMYDAVTAKRCRHALWTDSDAIVLNWDIKADFSLPGAVMGSASSGQPYAMYVVDKAPRGMPRSINDTDIDYCSSRSPCSSLKMFSACFNSGVFILNDSPTSLDYMIRVVSGAMSNISLTRHCSTASTNPYGADQCAAPHQDWDQCISGCIWKQEKRDDDDQMPSGVLCVDPNVRPRVQQVLKVFVDDVAEFIHADTFVVNIAGLDSANDMLLEKLFASYPHLKSIDARGPPKVSASITQGQAKVQKQ